MKLRASAPDFLRRTQAEKEDIDAAEIAVAASPLDAETPVLQTIEETESSDSIADSRSDGIGDDSNLALEAELVKRARGDPQAFAGLYEQHVERIYAYIYHRVGNAHDAEDLTARTFYRALERLDQYEDRGLPFSAWLFRIAHNLVANWHRDRQRRRFLSFDRLWGHSHDGDSPEGQVEREARQAALWAAIDRLPEQRRNLLLLKFGGELSNIEIGDFLDKSESAIKSLYFRTLTALRKDLEAHGWGADGEDGPDAIDNAADENGPVDEDKTGS